VGCEISVDNVKYHPPKVDFETWSQEKLDQITILIEEKIAHISLPVLVVFELGHFTLPREEKNIEWAAKNVSFVDRLAQRLIKRYQKKVKFLATLLINNLESEDKNESEEILCELFDNKRYIPKKSLKILSERNLKNRAYKALKKNAALADSFIHIDGKAYLKDEEYQHDLAAGFVDEKGDIIPRCGLILTSFLDKISEFARIRMHPLRQYEVLFVSFSQEFFEYQRVKLGVDIYTSTHDLVITPIVMHWDYSRDCCLVSHRNSDSKQWETNGR
jgi:hypothetical protein